MILDLCGDSPAFDWKAFEAHITVFDANPTGPDDVIPLGVYKFISRYQDKDLERYMKSRFGQDYTVELVHGANGDNTYEAFPLRLFCRNVESRCDLAISSDRTRFMVEFEEYRSLKKIKVMEVNDEPCI